MFLLKKIIFSLFFLLILCQFFLTTKVLAQENSKENFTTTIESTYTVSRNGLTTVSHHIRITNKTPTIYLKQYALTTTNFNLQNITIRSGQKQIPANIVSNEGSTSIGITFDDDVVGQGKVRDFYIEYSSPDIAIVAGSVLEVHIPQFGDSESFDVNKTTLFTPVFFSFPVRVSPQPVATEFAQTEVKTVFDRPSGESISAIFGLQQNYKMTVRYHLENPSSNPAIAQIALPPDTQYQKMHYHSLDPAPDDIKQDPDGNWIATYQVPASSVTVVHLTAEAKLTLDPNNVPVIPVQKNHIQADKYWESNNNLIQQKAQQFPTAQSIYNHVVETLTYSRKELTLENIIRYGAVDAFKNSEDAVCQEFTDSFIAVARAANIPSRRLVGYAYSQNTQLRPASFAGDILHAWPEYFDYEKNRWIQIDPTWGNTTGGVDYFNLFDLNHIVFSINGNSSTSPNPAGSYKTEGNSETKDIDISISDTPFPNIEPQITTRVEQKKFFFMPIPGMYTLFITNTTGQAWYGIQPQIVGDPTLTISFAEDSTLGALLPFQTKKFDITFFTKGFSIPKMSEVTVNYAWQNTGKVLYEPTTQQITSGPQLIASLQKKETYIYLGAGVIVVTLITGSVLVYRSRIQSFIRRQSKSTQK